MSRLCSELHHIRCDKIAIGFSKARTQKSSGLLASLTPLRFEDGATVTSRRGSLYEIPLMVIDGITMLYILNFLFPRFIDLPVTGKVHTIIHELWHISEKFDGDIRRFPGRTYAHSGRKANFDKAVEDVAKSWLDITTFDTSILSMNSLRLKNKFGQVVGQRITKPRLTRLP
jgi:hypothetical protein